MAASLSRPDPTSPASVAQAGFSTARRGFHQDEVRAFLASVATELTRLRERERELEAELRSARDAATAEPELDEDAVTRLLGEETVRVLQTARESASQIKIRAEESAARIIREASDEANRMRQDAEVEAARKRNDAASDAEAEVALAKQQGREMVNEARAYRERVLADLERRTTLARQQIEELMHGRERLLQVFERARLVAVDVTTELQAVDRPDELVNFSPTTGPVPLMVPTGSPARHGGGRDELGERTDPGSAEPALDDAPVDKALVDTAPVDTAPVDPAADATVEGAADVEADAGRTPPVDGELGAGEPAATETDATGPGADEPGADEPAMTESPEMEPAPGEPAAADPTAAAVAETEDATPPVDGGGPGDASAASAAAPARNANVVSLFRDRPDAGDAATDAGAAPAGGDGRATAQPDVGGIFERLRSEVPAAIEAATETPADTAPADTAPADTAPADVATADTAPADVATADAEPADAEPADAGQQPGAVTPFSRRDEALVTLIVAAARKLKRVLADEQNGVLDTLRRAEPVTSLDNLLVGVDDHVGRYVSALDDDLRAAAAAGATEFGANDTKTLRRTLERAGALRAANALIRTDLVLPLRDRLERSIAEGAGDNDDITRRVRAVYREWKTQHIDDQLDDVFRFAHGGGAAVTAEPGTPLVWTIDPSHPACPDCEDNSLAGPVPAGEPYPTGHTSAPAHPGCRCMTVAAAQ